jgi:hypothetical protein
MCASARLHIGYICPTYCIFFLISLALLVLVHSCRCLFGCDRVADDGNSVVGVQLPSVGGEEGTTGDGYEDGVVLWLRSEAHCLPSPRL